MVLFLILTGHAMNDSEITMAISLCKKIVSSFSYSWRRQRQLAEVQMQLGLPAQQLITESATRWGLRQQMIERILEQEAAITKVLSSDKKSRHVVHVVWGAESYPEGSKTPSGLHRCPVRGGVCHPFVRPSCVTYFQHKSFGTWRGRQWPMQIDEELHFWLPQF